MRVAVHSDTWLFDSQLSVMSQVASSQLLELPVRPLGAIYGLRIGGRVVGGGVVGGGVGVGGGVVASGVGIPRWL